MSPLTINFTPIGISKTNKKDKVENSSIESDSLPFVFPSLLVQCVSCFVLFFSYNNNKKALEVLPRWQQNKHVQLNVVFNSKFSEKF